MLNSKNRPAPPENWSREPKRADDRRVGGVADQPVVAGIAAHAPIAAELVGEAGHRADRVEAAVADRRRAGPRRAIATGSRRNRRRESRRPPQRARGPIEKM